MIGKKQFSKGQATVAVRRILAQYQVDMTKINFSANAKSLYFSGSLKKISGKEMVPQEVLNMVNDLAKLGRIRSDLDNWVLDSNSAHFTGKDEKKKNNHKAKEATKDKAA